MQALTITYYQVDQIHQGLLHLDRKVEVVEGRAREVGYPLSPENRVRMARNLSSIRVLAGTLTKLRDAAVEGLDEDAAREALGPVLGASVTAEIEPVDSLSLSGVPLSVLAYLWPLCRPLWPAEGVLDHGKVEVSAGTPLRSLWRSLYSLEGVMESVQTVDGESVSVCRPYQMDQAVVATIAHNISEIESGSDPLSLEKLVVSDLNLETNPIPVDVISSISPILEA